MIIFIYGEDNYRSRKKLNEIIAYYKKINNDNLKIEFFDILDNKKEKSINSLNKKKQTSLFNEKRIKIFFNIFSNPQFKEKLLKESESLLKSKDIIIIFENNNLNHNDPLFKFLKTKAKCQEFQMLDIKSLKNWIKKEFEKYKAKPTEESIDKLIEYVGNDLWRLENEIKKIINFRKIIKKEDIEFLVKPKIETNIFNTIDAIAKKEKHKALKLLHQHLENGDSPTYLLSMISLQFRNILIIKDLIERKYTYNDIIKKTKLHPFVVQKNYYQAKKFNIQELKKIYQKIFETDLNIKTGKINPDIGLDLLIAEI